MTLVIHIVISAGQDFRDRSKDELLLLPCVVQKFIVAKSHLSQIVEKLNRIPEPLRDLVDVYGNLCQ